MFTSYFLRYLRDESGNTAIEYAFLASLIAVAIVGSITALGGSLSTVYSSAATSLAR